MRWAGHIAHMGEKKIAYRILVGKPEEKRPLGIHRRRWEGDIKMYHREIRRGDMDRTHLTHDRDQWKTFVYTVMNLRVV
jgi:hypothetical protein